MLRFKAHNALRDYVEGECTRIVIYDEYGNPVAFTVQLGNNQYISSHIGNSDFETYLKLLNIDKLVKE